MAAEDRKGGKEGRACRYEECKHGTLQLAREAAARQGSSGGRCARPGEGVEEGSTKGSSRSERVEGHVRCGLFDFGGHVPHLRGVMMIGPLHCHSYSIALPGTAIRCVSTVHGIAPYAVSVLAYA
eukprot:1514234-Rhodomonas_salina.1